MSQAQAIELRSVLLVEDHPAAQRRMHALLAQVAGTQARVAVASDLASARTAANAGAFDLALVDVRLPDGNGVDLVAWLGEHHPRIACVVITALADEETVVRALRAGAVGYLLKERDDAELALALRNVQRGGAPIDPFVARRILELLPDAGDVPATPPEAELSDRECEILELVARGRSNRQIAEAIGLSRFTVEDYTKRIYRKLAVGSRAAAVFKAQSKGLLG